ncbi:hypothetical protein KIW84_063329 [Lathyrus oleraceus]|uniref:Uncharacterized protein n=1 Tax=Pisum sativum TaxID=3888 RepID=A0A9D4WAW7_PEA|nr:hypothetical protein KIW84_063329 [Pisum sativum]
MEESVDDVDAEEIALHQPRCYFVLNDGSAESQEEVFERPTMTMKNHLKPLLIRAKVEGVTVNKVLVDCGATVNIMPHHILRKIGKEWIHGVGAVPSLAHQRLVIWREDGVVENIEVDQGYFMVDVNNVGKKEYERKLANISPCFPAEDVYANLSEAFVSLTLHETHGFIWDVERLDDQPYTEAKENMVVEAYTLNKEGYMAIGPEPPDRPVLAKGNVNMQRLDCIYDNEPLGFEKDPKAPEKI